MEGNGASLGVGGWGGALRVRKQFGDKFADAAFANKTVSILTVFGKPIKLKNLLFKTLI